ncbi:hypothetical protein AB3N04_02750 [Alkalihalophilus sp. As8PL]|uniref:Uncharacterized protein n=1 Tax=Alkalihalophilus sp. As8PL TaxID=3237103 RepID=A0AB39BV25_9BACI
MLYFVIGFLYLSLILFSSIRVAKKEGIHRGFLFFFIQFSSATLVFHEFISYNFFLFGILCGVASIIGYALTLNSHPKRLGALGLCLVGYYAFVYFTPNFIPEPTYTLSDLEEAYETLQQQILHEDYVSADEAFREISSTSTYISFMELEIERSQNHLSRLLAPDTHIDKGQQKKLKAIRNKYKMLVENFVDEAMNEVFEARDGLFLFEEVNEEECYQLDDLTICQTEERYQINLEEEVNVSRMGISRYSLFDSYYLIQGVDEQYYIKLGNSYTFQENQLQSDYDGTPYTISGRISWYLY